MKSLYKIPFEIVELKENECIPNELEFGKFYYSKEFKGSSHLCLCGCGVKCYLPIKNGEWYVNIINNKLSVTPSILQRFDCKSHYVIDNGYAIMLSTNNPPLFIGKVDEILNHHMYENNIKIQNLNTQKIYELQFKYPDGFEVIELSGIKHDLDRKAFCKIFK